MNKIRILAVVVASALAAALAFALPAATAASRSGSPPPAGTVRLTGGLRLDPALRYRTALAHPRSLTAATVTSSNWSGYEITAKSGQTIGKVQALFTVPDVNCAKSTLGTGGDALWSDWVGLDGFSDTTVEQTGVAASCTSTTGPAAYFGFYEMFPLDAVTFTGISPGDSIVVVVQKVSGKWHLILQDRTNGGGMSTAQACPSGSTCKDASGEAITEDYDTSVPENNLADFGLTSQTDLAAASGSGQAGTFSSGTLWTSNTIDMANGADRMATPGPLYAGQAFFLGWNAGS